MEGSVPPSTAANAPAVFGDGAHQSAPAVFGAGAHQSAPAVFGDGAHQSAPAVFGDGAHKSAPAVFGDGAHQSAPAVFGDGAHKYVPVASMEAVLAERFRQIAKFGHTPQADAALPLKQLPREAARFLNAAIEDVQFHREGWRQHARRHLIRAGAMILAAMDRIEAEPPDQEIAL